VAVVSIRIQHIKSGSTAPVVDLTSAWRAFTDTVAPRVGLVFVVMDVIAAALAATWVWALLFRRRRPPEAILDSDGVEVLRRPGFPFYTLYTAAMIVLLIFPTVAGSVIFPAIDAVANFVIRIVTRS